MSSIRKVSAGALLEAALDSYECSGSSHEIKLRLIAYKERKLSVAQYAGAKAFSLRREFYGKLKLVASCSLVTAGEAVVSPATIK